MDVTQGEGGIPRSAGMEESRSAVLLARWGERLNPLVVKEVRQGLRSRLFWVSFGLMLFACFVLSLAAYATSIEDRLTPRGATFLLCFFACLGVVHFLLLPYGAYRSLAREREDETWVLLILTGLGPRRILRGKVGSCMVQGGLYASAVAPFLLFSYYLNGIELPTLLLLLFLGVCWALFLTVVAVCAASLANERLGRGLVHLVLLGGLVLAFIFAQTAAYLLCEAGIRAFSMDDFLPVFILSTLWMIVSGAWLLFETAAARLSLRTENYSRGPRRALVVQVVLSALFVLGLWSLIPSYRSAGEMVFAMSVLGSLYLMLCGLALATDLDGQARPLRADTHPWSLLRPGALRGFRLAVLLLLAWGTSCGVLMVLPPSRSLSVSDLCGLLSLPLYALLFLSLPLWLARLPFWASLPMPVMGRLLFVALNLPLLATRHLLSEDESAFAMLHPFIGVSRFVEAEAPVASAPDAWSMLICLALLTTLVAFLTDRALVAGEQRVHAE